MRLVSEPSTIHYLARMSRPFNIKKSIQYPQKQLPCQIPGGSVQYILSKALTQTDLKLRGCSHVSAPDRMLFIIWRFSLRWATEASRTQLGTPCSRVSFEILREASEKQCTAGLAIICSPDQHLGFGVC